MAIPADEGWRKVRWGACGGWFRGGVANMPLRPAWLPPPPPEVAGTDSAAVGVSLGVRRLG